MVSILNPALYVRRNLGKTLPLVFVIILAVMLVASVVSIVHSVDLTIFTLYGYNRYLTGLTPRNSLTIEDAQLAKVRRAAGLGSLFPAHSYQTMVKTIFGKMPLPIFGLDAAGRNMLMVRCGVRLVSGRMLRDGRPEAVMSDDVATNLRLRIGDIVCEPSSWDSYAPVPIRLVGLVHGPVWLAMTSRALVDRYSPFTFTGYLAFASTSQLSRQRALDSSISRVVDRGKVRVWRYAVLVREARASLANLYLILDIVIGIIVFAISFVCGLLSNIYFTQRMPEIATLAALGYGRRFLLARAAGETVLVCILGWVGGVLVTIGLLQIVYVVALRPRGLLLAPLDLAAFDFAAPLPVCIILFAVGTIAARLAALDPVSIIEHRA